MDKTALATLESRFFIWESWDQLDTMVFTFGGVKFVADFGPFKRGEKLGNLSLDYGHGLMETYSDDDGLVVKSCSFTLVPT